MSEMTNSDWEVFLRKIEEMAEEVRRAALKAARETLSKQGFGSDAVSLLAGTLVGKDRVSEDFWDEFYGDACDVLDARQGGAA